MKTVTDETCRQLVTRQLRPNWILVSMNKLWASIAQMGAEAGSGFNRPVNLLRCGIAVTDGDDDPGRAGASNEFTSIR